MSLFGVPKLNNQVEDPETAKVAAGHHEGTGAHHDAVDFKHEAHTHVHGHKHDAALDLLQGGRVSMTDENSNHVKRKIDKHILPILMW